MEEKNLVFYVKSDDKDFKSVDIKLNQVRSTNSPSLC